jgi:hypothetical protein
MPTLDGEDVFFGHCETVKDEPNRDALIEARNRLGFRPSWIPAPEQPSQDPPPPPPPPVDAPFATTPFHDTYTDDLEDAWNPHAPDPGSDLHTDDWSFPTPAQSETFSMYLGFHYTNIHLTVHIAVDEDWLDNDLRKLPLFLTIAGGSRSLKCNVEHVHAMLQSSYPGDTVDLRLLREEEPRQLKNVHIRHMLPRHPSIEDLPSTPTGKQYVVFIKGALKRQPRLLVKVEGSQVWVKAAGGSELTEHSKYDFVLSRDIKEKGKGKGKAKKI